MTWHIVSMQRAILMMLALNAVVGLCTMPSAYSFELSCADQRSKPSGSDDTNAPIEISGTFTCAALTSPRPDDIIVASRPEFVSQLITRYYFYAFAHDYDENRYVYRLIKLSPSLGKGEGEPGPTGNSTEEYFHAVSNGDCIVNDFFIFGRTAAGSSTLLIAVQNDWRNIPEQGIVANSTRLRAFILKNEKGDFVFVDRAAKALDKYYCTPGDVLPEVESFRNDIDK